MLVHQRVQLLVPVLWFQSYVSEVFTLAQKSTLVLHGFFGDSEMVEKGMGN